MKVIAGFIAAVVAAYIFGAAFVSQGNIATVVSLGYEVTFAQRIDALIHDVTHMYDVYLPLVAIGLAIGLSVAAAIIRFVPHLRMVGYVSAGFVGMIALHVLAKAALGVSGIAPTREITGLLAQGIAGGIGGFVFHWVTVKREAVADASSAPV
ncbi:MAG: hypothetical protein ISP91_00200 [Pseudomonadales bacterium]|jgi:hypothetical protein|nr:hypothetical protein [Pseudomonadales bacterium]